MKIIQIMLTDEQFEELRALADIENSSCRGLIYKAVRAYLERSRSTTPKAFGIWKDRMSETGLEYQERLRAEW